MNWFKTNWAQLKYLLVHKYYVAKGCIKQGFWYEAIMHDFSKFRPSEWVPYRKFFYKKERNAKDEFDRAVLTHYHRNSHHWQNYVKIEVDKVTALQMKDEDAIKMVIDWKASSMAKFGYDNSKKWYQENGKGMILHPITRLRIECLIGL